MNNSTKTTTAIIQARMTSSRLPGKVLMEVLDRPLLWYMIERVKDTKRIDRIIVATTTNVEDDPIVKLADELDVLVFRGAEKNVLERFYLSAKKFKADPIMRLTADCPLIDPEFLDLLIDFFFENGFDYACNCYSPTLPNGLDSEVFRFWTLEKAYQKAKLPSHLEHVTPFIRYQPERFKIGNWQYHKDHSGLRWTVDEPEDFEFVKQIIEILYPQNRKFRLQDILDVLKNQPELICINEHVDRNAGKKKSLEEDKKWLSKQI